METIKTYLTTKQAIEESNKEHGLIPSEFLATFPNNFGINLCAVRGFNVEETDDGQLKRLTVDFIPVPKNKLEKPHIYILRDSYDDIHLVKSLFDMDEEQLNDFMNEGIDEDEQDYYDYLGKIPFEDVKEYA